MASEEIKSPLLTSAEVCQRLKISRSTFFNLRKQGEIASVIIGGSLRYTEEEITRFLEKKLPAPNGQ